MCEQVRQEITCVLGVIMYFPKRGEITPAEDAGIPGAIPSPPPLALYGWYHSVQLINLSSLHCSHAFAAQFVTKKQHLIRAEGQKYGSPESAEVPQWAWEGPLVALCFCRVNLHTVCSSAQSRYWTQTKWVHLVEQIGPDLYLWQAVYDF